MASWRDEILSHFEPGGPVLIVVHDPDHLLTEERVLNGILSKGYEVLIYEDPVAFRYAYETNYRSAWNVGEGKQLVVLVQAAEDVMVLPYDVLGRAKELRFSLCDFFPGLAAPVVEALDRSLLDALWDAYRTRQGMTLGDDATREFVLTHCYHVAPYLVKTPADLMKYLLGRHYRGEQCPRILDDLLLEVFRQQPDLSAFPLERILSSRQEFLSYLQDQWESYVGSPTAPGSGCVVPFEHQDVRVYVDNLFLEGFLQPVEMPEPTESLPAWTRFGVVTDAQGGAQAHFDELLSRSEDRLPADDAPYRDWQSYANLWAETVVSRWQPEAGLPQEQTARWARLHVDLERRFGDWMLAHFGALASIPAHPLPVMVHQIPRYLSALRSRGEIGKLALLVIDGLAMDQWLVVRHGLGKLRPEWRYDATPTFTWVPSLTSVCRQAIFAGKPPLWFPRSVGSTGMDESQWLRFWEEQDVDPAQVRFSLGKAEDLLPWLDESLQDADIDTLGMVLSDVDDMVHGSTLGTEGLHRSVGVWVAQRHLMTLIARLQADGFAVFIASDHGNIQATGIGLARQGVLVQSAGSRARIYQSKELRSTARQDLPDALEWPGSGLPPGHEVLLPQELRAFTTAGNSVVTHGGIALEESIVPFIRVTAGGTDGA